MSESVALQFSRAAASYERGAGLHRHVAARLVETLPDPGVPGTGSILELGSGTGVLSARIRQRFPDSILCAVDIAEGMASCLHESRAADDKFLCVVADARTFASRRPFDLVVSSSALHWARPLPEVMSNIGRLLKPGGPFVAALMVEDTLRELHALRRSIAPGKVPPGRLPASRDIIDALETAGFEVESQFEETVRARYHSAEDFLRTIHAQGLTGGWVSRAATPLTRSELRELVGAYDLAYRDLQGGVYATFEVLYVSAILGPHRAESPETRA